MSSVLYVHFPLVSIAKSDNPSNQAIYYAAVQDTLDRLATVHAFPLDAPKGGLLLEVVVPSGNDVDAVFAAEERLHEIAWPSSDSGDDDMVDEGYVNVVVPWGKRDPHPRC